jgi:hypothetical protein
MILCPSFGEPTFGPRRYRLPEVVLQRNGKQMYCCAVEVSEQLTCAKEALLLSSAGKTSAVTKQCEMNTFNKTLRSEVRIKTHQHRVYRLIHVIIDLK